MFDIYLHPTNLLTWIREFQRTSKEIANFNHPDAAQVSLEYKEATQELKRLFRCAFLNESDGKRIL